MIIFIPLLVKRSCTLPAKTTAICLQLMTIVSIQPKCANLYPVHQEADSKMLFHVASIPSPANIVIRSVDTDVLVIALACLSKIDPRKKVWMETELVCKNSLRYININQIYQTLGEQICRGLPALHTLQALTTQVVLVEKKMILVMERL